MINLLFIRLPPLKNRQNDLRLFKHKIILPNNNLLPAIGHVELTANTG